MQGREPREDARTSGRTAPPPSGLPDRLTRATGYHLVTNRAKNQEVYDRTSEAYDCDALTGYPGDGALYLLLGVLEVHELSRQVLLVGTEVEVAVAAEVEEDGFLLAGLFGFER